MIEQRPPVGVSALDRKDGVAARASFALGRKFAPLFEAFVRWVVEQVQKDGFHRVFYFTREGEFFAAIHRAIVPTSTTTAPQPLVLEVSRLATFAPSLTAIVPETLRSLWARYPRQTLHSVFTSLGLRTADLPIPATRWHLSDHEPLDPADPRWAALLLNDRNARWLEEHRVAQRAALDAYLTGRGWSEAEERIAIVDIGWHGSIQDHLAHIRPACDIRGYYFGLIPQRSPSGESHQGTEQRDAPHNAQCRKSFVTEFLAAGDDRLAGQFLKFVGPMEMLCNAPGGSVVGYAIGASGVRAVRRASEGEERTFERYTQHFQAGVLQSLASAASVGNRCPLPGNHQALADAVGRPRMPDRRHCWRLFRELMIDPPRLIAVAYDRLLHDESFGLGCHVALGRWIPSHMYWDALVSAEARQRLWQRITTVPWPHGYLVARRLRWICDLLNLRYFRNLSDPCGVQRPTA